ncbi:hypothetical protein KPG71_08365 [Roseovarius sp. PS-C2]|uniref:hypothetical protein n=1 Tax=Roseovarius sp. PS-C2 TaxID=2820814 RepID=UPI001C0DF387|nr:hypothetical protein [Roseovarius sp. PS-C2]MBU3260002.1 hypothetical protein [Roseovarius sp. PS-C2]MBU3260020.1 hypothetical protein [Roseovarius sp. PS-C2]
MSDTDFPAGVHVLRPRKVSVSKKLDGFLEKAGLANSNNNKQNDTTRPRAGSLNAFTCADCGQIEYLTREYCRCGHYLRGQLEDEYLAWEQGIHALHTELSDEVELKLKPLRKFYLLAIPFMLVPAMNVLFWSNNFALITLLWWLPAVLIAGAGLFAEDHLIRPLKESARFVDSYTFETFIEQRSSF